MATLVALSAEPILRFTDVNGNALVGGLLTTLVGGVNYPTYSESTGTVALPNPIVLNSRGEISTNSGISSPMYVVPNVAYTYILQDALLNTIWTAPNIVCAATTASVLAALTQQVLGGILYPVTTAETAASVVPVNYWYQPGDIRRYGAVLDGATNDTPAVQRWLSVGGALTFPVAQTALVNANCTMASNTTILAVKGATILTTTGGVSMFTATGKSNIVIDGLTFKNTHIGVAFPTTFAHTQFFTCTSVTVKNCEFIGMQCGGMEFDGCTVVEADNNYLHGGLGISGQTQIADIALYGLTGATTQAVITNNQCYGGNAVGIFDQNEYSLFIPSKNIISGNRVSGPLLYGIACYKPSYASLNSYDQIIGNYVENVQGAAALLSGQGGAGIYVVGGASGGTLVTNNEIVNCCVQTTTASQATGGISVASTNGQIFFTASVGGATSGTLGTGGSPFANGNWNGASSATWLVTFTDGEQKQVTLTNGATTCSWTGALSAGSILSATLAPYYNDPITVSGNKVSGMTQYDGLLFTGNNGAGIAAMGNTVNMPASNTTGYALDIKNSTNVNVTGGVLVNQGTGPTALVNNALGANNITLKGINISGGGNSASTGCVEITGDGTHGVSGLILSGLQIAPSTGGSGSAAIYMTTNAATGAQISDCYVNCATMPALLIAGCTAVRVSNCILASTGTNTLTTSGACTGGFFDKSNLVSGGLINNGATGFHVDQFGAAAPGTGTWAKGDTIYNDISSTSTNAVFICTVAGSPGTFVGHV